MLCRCCQVLSCLSVCLPAHTDSGDGLGFPW